MKELNKPQTEQVTGAVIIKRPPYTTLALGEEGGHVTTFIVGEEGGHVTSYVYGEEGPVATTLAIGEEGGGGGTPIATTSALGSF